MPTSSMVVGDLNAFLEGREVAALCIYHDEGCEARQLMDLMRTHRRVLINNALFENPYFEPPDQHRDRRDS